MKKLSIQFQLYFLKSQYVLFDVLSNITNANKYFVRKKIYIGVAIIALSVINSCSSSENSKKVSEKKKDSIPEITTTCYDVAIPPPKDSTQKTINQTVGNTGNVNKPKKSKNKLLVDMGVTFTCYIVADEPPIFMEDTANIEMKQVIDSVPISVNTPTISCYVIIEPQENVQKDKELTLHFADQMPTFKGGKDSMTHFISKNLKYPQEALTMGVEGKVIVQFTVTSNGDIINIEVIRSIDPELDKEAIRIINLMPKWNPGKQNEQKVNVRITLPIIFKIPE